MAKRAHPPAEEVVHDDQPRFYIDEHAEIRRMSRADLASELGTTEESVSRWVNDKRGVSLPNQHAIEKVFGLPPGGLRLPPGEAPAKALLAGLSPDKKKQALEFIEFLRKDE